MFESNNPIKKFSLSIASNICEDIIRPIDLFVSAGQTLLSVNNQLYGLILDDLSLYDNLLYVINLYHDQLCDGGMLIMNILGGASLDELVHSMMNADLYENRFITRMLPKISAEGLLLLANKSYFKHKTVMTSRTTINYSLVSEIIQSLREIKLTKKLSNTQPTSRKYWQSVQKIFSDLYGQSTTIEIITLFAVK